MICHWRRPLPLASPPSGQGSFRRRYPQHHRLLRAGTGAGESFTGAHYASIFATLMLSALVGGAVGPFLTGALHDRLGGYTLAFAIAVGLSGLSAPAIRRAAPRKVRAVAAHAL